MKKIAEIQPKEVPAITAYYDNKVKMNPYRVYFEWYEYVPDEGVHMRKKQINRFADLYSCVLVMANYVRQNNEEGR